VHVLCTLPIVMITCSTKLVSVFQDVLVSIRRFVYAIGEGTMKSTLLFVGILAAGCAKNQTAEPDPGYVAGFDPGAVPDGYTRYLSPIVKDIAPGADVEYCQWVAPASVSAQDVLALQGKQSLTGHHAILYATSNTSYPVGESHICTVADMIPLSFVGAIGGEGTGPSSGSVLPEGLYFRVPPGQALMINSHWLNATDDTVDGQAAIDVKFVAASDTRVTADLFGSTGDAFTIPAHGTQTYDNSCVLKEDLNFAMLTDHMHTNGTSIYTEVRHVADGTTEMLVADNPWSPEEQFNPAFKVYSMAAPVALHMGDTLHTHCEWNNTTGSDLMFPDEMCVSSGFYFPGHGQIICDDGDWSN